MSYTRLTAYISLSVWSLAFLYYGIPWIYGKLLRMLLRKRVVKAGALVLTFDDGPGSRLTPVILDILKAHDIKATFFVLGSSIEGRENLVKRIAKEGHQICSHGYHHVSYWRIFPRRTLADIEKGRDAVNKVTGSDDCLYPFRPPYGKLNLISLIYLWLYRLPIYYWTMDSGDTLPPKRRNCRRIAERIGETGGAVLLVHDFDRTDEHDEEVEDYVLDVVKAVIEKAEQKGMAIETMEGLMREQS